MTELGTCNLAEYVVNAFNKEEDGVSVEDAQRISFQLLVGLAELHMIKYAHRDVKPGNIILVGERNTAKLIDLGSFKYLDDVKTGDPITLLCTRDYAGPEILRLDCSLTMQRSYGVRIDSWSWAATFVHMATGDTPWSAVVSKPSASAEQRLGALERRDVREVLGEYPRPLGGTIGGWLGEEGLDVLVGAAQWHLADRKTAAELLKHPWYKQLRQELVGRVEGMQMVPLAGAAKLSPNAPVSCMVKEWKELGLV